MSLFQKVLIVLGFAGMALIVVGSLILIWESPIGLSRQLVVTGFLMWFIGAALILIIRK